MLGSLDRLEVTMSALNPYASFLGDRDPIATTAATPQALRALIERLGPEAALRPPASGKWSPREIACHLADTEIVFAFRLRQAAAEPHHVIQPFDQEAWSRVYAAFAVESAIGLFASVRDWNLTLVRSLAPSALAKPVSHPERGLMTLQTIVETMAGHDLNHLGQLERIAGGFRS
jgi:uncharacterized damage-inducible protein DinB